MKYTICGFQQERFVECGLDCVDAVILNWFVDFYRTGEMAKVSFKGKIYSWLKYQAVIDNLPICRITSKQVIARRFGRYVACGLLEKHIKKHKGVYTCFWMNEDKYRLLTQVPPEARKVRSDQLKSTVGTDSKVDTKDSPINNSTTGASPPEGGAGGNKGNFTPKRKSPRNRSGDQAIKPFSRDVQGKKDITVSRAFLIATGQV